MLSFLLQRDQSEGGGSFGCYNALFFVSYDFSISVDMLLLAYFSENLHFVFLFYPKATNKNQGHW